MAIKRVTLKQLLASGRSTESGVKGAQTVAKTARAPYVMGFTPGGARVEVQWSPSKKRYTYQLSGYAQDGSDLQLTR